MGRVKKESASPRKEDIERLTSPAPDDPDYRFCRTCRHLHPEYSFRRRGELWKTCGFCGTQPKIGHTKDEHCCPFGVIVKATEAVQSKGRGAKHAGTVGSIRQEEKESEYGDSS